MPPTGVQDIEILVIYRDRRRLRARFEKDTNIIVMFILWVSTTKSCKITQKKDETKRTDKDQQIRNQLSQLSTTLHDPLHILFDRFHVGLDQDLNSLAFSVAFIPS